jgi:hypothetical protein
MVFFPDRICRALLAIALVAVAGGCQSGAFHSSRSGRGGGDADSTLSREVATLREQVQEQKLELARTRAELQTAVELNRVLEEELAATKGDLEVVERQFVSMERRLIRDETKASAVAAIAEVRLLLDNLKKQEPRPLDADAIAEVESKIASANELTRRRNYSAAVYYANRAMRILNQSERRHEVIGDRMIVAVTRANLRKGPGSSYDIITRLQYGTIIVQLDETKDWVHVRTRSGVEGWIHASLLQ